MDKLLNYNERVHIGAMYTIINIQFHHIGSLILSATIFFPFFIFVALYYFLYNVSYMLICFKRNLESMNNLNDCF